MTSRLLFFFYSTLPLTTSFSAMFRFARLFYDFIFRNTLPFAFLIWNILKLSISIVWTLRDIINYITMIGLCWFNKVKWNKRSNKTQTDSESSLIVRKQETRLTYFVIFFFLTKLKRDSQHFFSCCGSDF